jgi:oxygen-independent coproporphyrinogen-3 oxidase
MKEISLYFHIPFCRRRCGYCDFNTFAGMNQYIPLYVKALCSEVEAVLVHAPEELTAHTLNFGGGTPSLLPPEDFACVFESVRKNASISAEAEISLEANPETVTRDGIKALREAGFNRISFGMQSAASRDLHVLDRQHDNRSILNAVLWSQQAGIEHINLDLIFGIPGQSLESWQSSLQLAVGLGVDHFSIYSLILEDGTRLKRWVDRGLLQNPDDDLAADMYLQTMELLEGHAYNHYVISNWARRAKAECRHNLQYWRYKPYLGFGAGAHGFWHDTRTVNVGPIAEYINRIQQDHPVNFPSGQAVQQSTRLSSWDRIQENMMVSMRLTWEGVSIPQMNALYQVEVVNLFGSQIRKLTRQGLLEFTENGNRMRLTRKGRLFGNRVFSEFIDNPLPRGFEAQN